MTTTRRKFQHAALVTVQDFLSLIGAVHLSSYVDSPYQDRGGLMVVGPPGALKTTMVNYLESFPDSLILSDINVQGLTKIKERISSNAIRSMVLTDLQKISERHSSVAINIEGTLRALAGEGFSAASFEDNTISRKNARATVIAATTIAHREKNAERWEDSGFARRFLWALVSLQDPRALDRAVIEGKLLNFAINEAPRIPFAGVIPNFTTKEERQELSTWIKYQPVPHTAQLSTLIKAWAVLKWWARQQRRSEDRAFVSLSKAAAAFGKNGVELMLT